MNAEKAKEYFSAYVEGTLDKGLRQQLDQKLASDANLRMEMEAFRSVITGLDGLRAVPVEIPSDLNDKIQARLDRHIWEKQRAKPAPWTLWFRNAAFAGLGALAIFGAINSLASRGEGSKASLAPDIVKSTSNDNQISARWEDKVVKLSYKPSGQRTVVVKAADGSVLKKVSLDNAVWESDLRNSNPNAATFGVQIEGETVESTYVVPGTQRSETMAGSGDLLKFAEAISNVYGVPVLLRAADVTGQVSWTFPPKTSLLEAVTHSVPGATFTAEMLEGGVLSLRQS